ncbi:hypothetical protein [Deinococcus sp. SL84]|uniref:hypothetical protein n=1 Tax=Deinococcus sp. SL84 TaxID=2994663 RepID=UPI0022754978|nr:hypothetical protein [Deinococcus sp. SL84]MCY1704308.1 hypothetical protein [Deinococcus sp. SL84]
MKEMLQEFLRIAGALNREGIVPTLLGSLGLSLVTDKDWKPSDIDIHVPGDPRGWEAPDEARIYNWKKIYGVMSGLGYDLVDLHEHEFRKEFSVEFGTIDALPEFADIELGALQIRGQAAALFYLPSAEQFLKIYEASSKDSYRAGNNNAKDLEKIKFLETFVKASGGEK